MSDSVTLWAVARQAPLSMGFSRQESWSGLPCPPPGDLPTLESFLFPGCGGGTRGSLKRNEATRETIQWLDMGSLEIDIMQGPATDLHQKTKS